MTIHAGAGKNLSPLIDLLMGIEWIIIILMMTFKAKRRSGLKGASPQRAYPNAAFPTLLKHIMTREA